MDHFCTETNTLNEIKESVKSINEKLDGLSMVEIEITNGKTKHVTYHRNEFFQMLYDRKFDWKDNVRTKIKDYSLLLGALTATIYFIQNLIK